MFELRPMRDSEPKFELPPAIKLEDVSASSGDYAAIDMPTRAPEGQPEVGDPLSIKSTGSWPANAEPPISGPPTFDEPAGWRLDNVSNEATAADFDLSAEIDRWRHVLELEFDPSEMGGASTTLNNAAQPTPPSAVSSSASSFIEEWGPVHTQQPQHLQMQMPSELPSPSLFEPDFPPSASAYEWQSDGADPWSAYRANDGAFYSASASSSSSAAGSEYSFNLETGSHDGASASGQMGELGATGSVDHDYDPTLALSFADFDLSLAGPPSVVFQQHQQQKPQQRSQAEEEESEEEERQRIRDAMARRGPSGDSRLALDREETWRPGRRTPDG